MPIAALIPLALLGGGAALFLASSAQKKPTEGGPVPPSGPPTPPQPGWPLPPGAVPVATPPGPGAQPPPLPLPTPPWGTPPTTLQPPPVALPPPPWTPPITPPPTSTMPGGMTPAQLDEVTLRDPHTGIRVFRKEYAQSIARQLASLRRTVSSTDPGLVVLSSDTVVPTTDSALGWALAENATKTVLAPTYMAFPSSAQKFLRSVPSGPEEEKFARDSMYAILAPPGQLPLLIAGMPGLPPTMVPPVPPVVPTPPVPPIAVPPVVPPVALPPSIPGTGSGDLDDLPPPVRKAVDDLLATPAVEPNAIEAAATALDQMGFQKVGDRLRARAKEIRAAKPGATPPIGTPPVSTPPVAVAPTERVLKAGDTAWGFAQSYTGNGNRWRELLPINPTLREVPGKTTGGKTTVFVQPWNPGQKVKIPVSWTAKNGDRPA